MRICADGHWEYMGSPIGRASMVRLFASVLRKEDDGCYYLVTPVEKVRIQVDDAPFVAIAAEQVGDDLIFESNVGDKVRLDDDHPLKIRPSEGSMAPYILVRGQLEARIHRNLYYELIHRSEPSLVNGTEHLCLRSGGRLFSLGEI